MEIKVNESNFIKTCKIFLREWFENYDDMIIPVAVFRGEDGLLQVQTPSVEGVSPGELHEYFFDCMVDMIQRLKITELFIGYQGFTLMGDAENEEEEKEGTTIRFADQPLPWGEKNGKAVRVLVGTFYSDQEDMVWIAQIHGTTVGEWRDISSNQNRFGFEGLWKLAKSYLNN